MGHLHRKLYRWVRELSLGKEGGSDISYQYLPIVGIPHKSKIAGTDPGDLVNSEC
jgi:hypothetical protein